MEKIQGNYTIDPKDAYYKILVGSNTSKTEITSKAAKNFSINPKLKFYAEAKENKITFILYDSKIISDEITAIGSISLDGLTG